MTVQIPTKSAVSVAEMAKMCGLSRARFYQLIHQHIMIEPLYDVATRRPFYDEEMQKMCLEVRRRNCGINGKPVLFYAPRHPLGQQPKPIKRPTATAKLKNQYADLIDGVRALGLETVTAAQVE